MKNLIFCLVLICPIAQAQGTDYKPANTSANTPNFTKYSWENKPQVTEPEHKEHWTCTDDSTQRQDNIWYSCGINQSDTEAVAMRHALQEALIEFDTLCKLSSDCHGHKRTMEPKRSSCVQLSNGVWKCWRMVQITVY